MPLGTKYFFPHSLRHKVSDCEDISQWDRFPFMTIDFYFVFRVLGHDRKLLQVKYWTLKMEITNSALNGIQMVWQSKREAKEVNLILMQYFSSTLLILDKSGNSRQFFSSYAASALPEGLLILHIILHLSVQAMVEDLCLNGRSSSP